MSPLSLARVTNTRVARIRSQSAEEARGSRSCSFRHRCGFQRRPAMLAIGGTNIGIVGMTLDGGFPFHFTDESADVYFQSVRFKARSWSRSVLYAQLFGNRHEAFWSEAELYVAQRTRFWRCFRFSRVRLAMLILGRIMNFRSERCCCSATSIWS
jgi:hypothetical protein